MSSVGEENYSNELNQRLATGGFRFTSQRQHVYNVLLEKRDHPTAEEVFLRTKQAMPEISIATVYNCLDALVKCNLVRQLNLDRGAARYCPNMREHGHFHCEGCGGVFDLEFVEKDSQRLVQLPQGFKVTHAELSFRGLCAPCASRELERS